MSEPTGEWRISTERGDPVRHYWTGGRRSCGYWGIGIGQDAKRDPDQTLGPEPSGGWYVCAQCWDAAAEVHK